MRTATAALLALLIALAALSPHVHAGEQGERDCAVCVAGARGATPPPQSGVELAPSPVVVAMVEPVAPERSPVLGLPLGAVPGQSPPRA